MQSTKVFYTILNSTIIQQNLRQNNVSLLLAMRTTIQNEIENALKDFKLETRQNIDLIQKKHAAIESVSNSLEQKIKLLTSECTKLKEENADIKQEILKLKLNDPSRAENSGGSHDKTIVLHGLNLHNWESESELIERVSYIFHDILNINIQQYIEEITYTGKKWHRSPLKIELSSKRMKKYILDNYAYFREVGLGVSEYLNKTTLKERRKLKEALINARKNGHHAVIRENKLIINGIESNGHYTSPRNESHNTIDQTQERRNTRLSNIKTTNQMPNTNNNIHTFRKQF